MYCFVFLQCSKNEWKIVQDVDFFFFPLCSLLIFTPAGFLVLMCEYTVHCHLCDTKPTIGFSYSKKCRKPSDKWIYQKLPLICVQKHRTHLPVITSVKLVLHLEFYLKPVKPENFQKIPFFQTIVCQPFWRICMYKI